MKTYGPYQRKDGRRVVIHYDGAKTTTQSYPRYLMEQHLGRKLEKWEQVDHIDDDPTNDVIENFQLLTAAENTQKAVDRKSRDSGVVTWIVLTCECGTTFKRRRWKVERAEVENRTLTCSRTCAARRAGLASGVSRRSNPIRRNP